MDPFNKFPPEISSEIIACASLTNLGDEWTREIISVDLLLELTYTSRRWQDLIMATPELWADIVINRDKDDAFTKVALQCNLSRGHALSITFATEFTDDIRVFLPFLGDHRQRIQELNVRFEEQLVVFLTALGPLPSLISLQFRSSYIFDYKVHHTTLSFINMHPHLKSIRGMRLTVDLLGSNWLHCLREVSLDVSLGELLPHLDALSNARRFRLIFSERADYGFLPLHRVHALPCLPWTQLEVTGSWDNVPWHLWQNLDVLVPALAQNLTSLRCNADLGLLSALLPRLADLAFLVEFEMFLMPHGGSFASEGDIKTTTVQILRIRSIDTFESTVGVQLTSLLPALSVCFRNITSIHFTGSYIGKFEPLLGQGVLPRLQAAHLTGVQSTFDPQLIISPTIQVLRLHDTRVNLQTYQSEGVKELELSPTLEYGSDDPSSGGIRLHNWPRLNQLSITGHMRVNWIGASLENLSAITLTVGSRYAPYQATRLLYYLGLYPSTFPRLVELELHSLIEWDIFFCFLETRTTRINGLHVCMKCITFRRAPPFGFSELISGLLSGNKVDRPSNLELSWMGNLELLQDHNLPGCLACIKSLYYCERGVATESAPDHVDLPVFGAYPRDDGNVLSTWPTREAEWDRYATSQRKRGAICYNFLTQRRVVITANGYYIS